MANKNTLEIEFTDNVLTVVQKRIIERSETSLMQARRGRSITTTVQSSHFYDVTPQELERAFSKFGFTKTETKKPNEPSQAKDSRAVLNVYTDLEINVELAKAIGWDADDGADVRIKGEDLELKFMGTWTKFNFMDWDTISPIALSHDCFPHVVSGPNEPKIWACAPHNISDPLPQRAMALAVIAQHWTLT